MRYYSLCFCNRLCKPNLSIGINSADQTGTGMRTNLPVEFSEKKNLTRKAAMPGKAWSSPVVRDGKVWITNAQEDGHKMWAVQLDWEMRNRARCWFLKTRPLSSSPHEQLCHPDSRNRRRPGIRPFRLHGTAALEADTGKKIWERRDFLRDHWRGAAAPPSRTRIP